ncbi:MAG: glycosyltransferase [Solirubrobacteraceae bacterium]
MARSIYFYTDSREFGGAERALLLLIENLDLVAWRPTLLLDHVPGGTAIAEEASALGIPVRSIAPMPLGIVGARRAPHLARLLRATRPDVFHAHLSWPLAAKYPLIAAVAARLPAVVATVHLIPEFRLDRSNFLQLRALAMGVGRYIAVSRNIATELRQRFRWPPHKIEVIHNGVRIDRYRVVAPPELRASLTDGRDWPIALTCARLDPQKCHAALLRAAADVPDTVFVFAGEGPQRSALQRQAVELGIADRVRFLGFRADVPQLLAAADVFALPSAYEGSPLAVLEAMAAARPVVGSAIGGTDELINDGVTGLLVRPGDHSALVQALARLVSDPELRRTLGRRAQKRAVSEFEAEAMARRVMRVYDKLLEGGEGA